VTLSVGSGPFGHRPSGRFNVEVPREGVQYLDDFPRRVRALSSGEVAVDSFGVKLLYEHGRLPVWCFPQEDVRFELLGKAAWTYEEGLAAGLVGVDWDGVDRWLEEEEEVIVHPRDPYHRIELRQSSRRVEVTLGGEMLAASSSPLALFEASLPARWYVSVDEVRAEILPNPDVRTGCAYKGWATYYDVRVGDRVEPALAWEYEKPLEGMERIEGLLCFFNERVDLRLDGELQERPQTRWSKTDWLKADRRTPKRLGAERLGEE
jgi:uncharacterized protein (DUF427 family)